ncbi:hypothetical protein SARC_01002 [Sphaeroforma arctica JP610]|uniref:Uncharacterized protein n=1 Tax=Sphaeroforma arctica JP610 TaxID=667725 RepID=A0A0L0GD91_9EUKA|nr:hypothetical protein SARC_01002 [Sphaeroforma arctica JP610]KNC86856.1 hypothetical protein SARC_01002 [Sphaeroforma arctica JP610]|eukprot:XP_014160758.1 hypothetical protein SARC_01002 [Sphaeroforma arctica JP610]
MAINGDAWATATIESRHSERPATYNSVCNYKLVQIRMGRPPGPATILTVARTLRQYKARCRTGHSSPKQRRRLHVSAVNHRHHRAHDISHAVIIFEQHSQAVTTAVYRECDQNRPQRDTQPAQRPVTVMASGQGQSNSLGKEFPINRLTPNYSNEAPAPDNNYGGWESVAERE